MKASADPYTAAQQALDQVQRAFSQIPRPAASGGAHGDGCASCDDLRSKITALEQTIAADRRWAKTREREMRKENERLQARLAEVEGSLLISLPIPRTLRWQNEREANKTETASTGPSRKRLKTTTSTSSDPTPAPSSDAAAPPRQAKPSRAKPKPKPCTLLIAARHERRPNARSRHGEAFGEKLPQVLCDDDAYEYELPWAVLEAEVFADAEEKTGQTQDGEAEAESDLSELDDDDEVEEDDDEEPGRLRPADEDGDVDMVESEDGLE